MMTFPLNISMIGWLQPLRFSEVAAMKMEYVFTRDELKKKKTHFTSKNTSGARNEHRDMLELVNVLKKLNIGYPEQGTGVNGKEVADDASTS